MIESVCDVCEGYGEDQLHRLIDVLPYASNELTDVFVSVWSLEPTTSPTRTAGRTYFRDQTMRVHQINPFEAQNPSTYKLY